MSKNSIEIQCLTLVLLGRFILHNVHKMWLAVGFSKEYTYLPTYLFRHYSVFMWPGLNMVLMDLSHDDFTLTCQHCLANPREQTIKQQAMVCNLLIDQS